MTVTRFPDPRRCSDPDGLLAVGGDLEPETLLLAYRQGIFPWPVTDPGSGEMILAWFSPPKRAILDFSELHIPRSLERARRKSGFTCTVDQAFSRVIKYCASVPRPSPTGTESGTWITPEMTEAYNELHRLGHAHSVETWSGSRLVGGIYGVAVDGAFAGESMFHFESNASKIALLHLAEHLRSRGLGWMDIQMTTPHLEALGAREISRDAYLNRLEETRALGLRLF